MYAGTQLTLRKLCCFGDEHQPLGGVNCTPTGKLEECMEESLGVLSCADRGRRECRQASQLDACIAAEQITLCLCWKCM